MLVGLLLVAIYRPERIYLPGMFRLSCVLLAVSIVVTPITSAIVSTDDGGFRQRNEPIRRRKRISRLLFRWCKSSSRSWSR